MDLKNFKNELKNIYNRFPEFTEEIDEYSDNQLKFLYLHLNDGIKLEISDIERNSNTKSFIDSKKISFGENAYKTIILFYKQFLTDIEIQILNSGKDLYVNTYSEKYDDKGSQEYFNQKNRRDFLIPCFYHENTRNLLDNFYHEETSSYLKKLNDFFVLLGQIRKNISTKNRLGTIMTSSSTLLAHNIREARDIDIIILHPNSNLESVAEKLKTMAESMDFMDTFIENIIEDEWEHNKKENMYMIDKVIEDDEINFYNIIFKPDYHHYFFGIKIISLDYNLKYRAVRRYPKNVADLILAQKKLNIDVPKIKPLENFIVMEWWHKGKDLVNKYSKSQFIERVMKYLIQSGYNIDYDETEKRIKDISS